MPNRGRGGRGGRFPQPGKKAPEKRPNITNESLGIPHNNCILCNEAGCRPFYTNCRYFGRTQIYSTNCGNCLAQGKLGAHSERSCLEPRVKKSYHASPDDDRSSITSFLAKFPKNWVNPFLIYWEGGVGIYYLQYLSIHHFFSYIWQLPHLQILPASLWMYISHSSRLTN